MKRYLIWSPLLLLSPLGHFCGSYFCGAGILPGQIDFLFDITSFFILSWAIPVLFIFIVKATWTTRILAFICAFTIQFALIALTPAGATAEMMGIAHRLGKEFSADQLRECASDLRQKHLNGTLKEQKRGKVLRVMNPDNEWALVDDSELPTSLRGRFYRVYIQKDQANNGLSVVFEIKMFTGIVCDSRKFVSGFFEHSIADGVHAFRYERQ